MRAKTCFLHGLQPQAPVMQSRAAKARPTPFTENISVQIPPIAPELFATTLLQWQASHGRHDLPWQIEPTPYRVLVSEVMLQQTQVTTVIPYFTQWMQAFPDIEALAMAPEDQVMAIWQGLGYYSRARNLQKAARYLVDACGGLFPRTLTELQQIPGVGRYTAGAIAAFAYDEYGPIVDGNVKRLFCRLFGIEGQLSSGAVINTLWELAHSYTPESNNRAFAQGLLDMGATLCTPRAPRCDDCPFQCACIARQSDRVSQLPTPKAKKVIPTRAGAFAWQEQDGKLLLEKRPPEGIWGGLWCLPELQSSDTPTDGTLKGQFDHTFSHYKLRAEVWQLNCLEPQASYQAWFTPEQLQEIGLPAPIRKFIKLR